MLLNHRHTGLGSFFAVSTDYIRDRPYLEEHKNLIAILWNCGQSGICITIDDEQIVLQPRQVTTTTYLQRVEIDPRQHEQLIAFTFNREFYCIQDHDHEVSCNGILFLGTQTTPIVTLDVNEHRRFDLLYQVFLEEFETRDNIQGEMLKMLLKRLIIKTTRLAKGQLINAELEDRQIDIIRKFNVLVDTNFRTKRTVAEYADLLFKSPKTLSNLFSKYNSKTPLQIIHERIVLEAKKLLIYTDKTAKEIAHELGFEETASFHKLFKKIVGVTPQQFKAEAKPGD